MSTTVVLMKARKAARWKIDPFMSRFNHGNVRNASGSRQGRWLRVRDLPLLEGLTHWKQFQSTHRDNQRRNQMRAYGILASALANTRGTWQAVAAQDYIISDGPAK